MVLVGSSRSEWLRQRMPCLPRQPVYLVYVVYMQMVDSRNDQEWVAKASGLKHAYPLAFSRLKRTSAVLRRE